MGYPYLIIDHVNDTTRETELRHVTVVPKWLAYLSAIVLLAVVFGLGVLTGTSCAGF